LLLSRKTCILSPTKPQMASTSVHELSRRNKNPYSLLVQKVPGADGSDMIKCTHKFKSKRPAHNTDSAEDSRLDSRPVAGG